MCLKNWKEKMEKKHWEEMQELKLFDKENFKGAERFSKFFSRIFKFFSFSFINILAIMFIISAIFYIALLP